ncbi:coenzyme F420-0:L-glutamate ligase/coenzyme F420-1:gamma-L-glutamate ligase [Rhodoligotrophos appendicifer]|uniref:coenzyme F420-0:L-glutamate ligase n=1 Tax=Rhodoligotrophos appendicifer TaxID=987056 RepID=UPI00117FA027|nr:coenzyme F420-0:L-glutamate ligase [Rhodoligotrophos appendicifer]
MPTLIAYALADFPMVRQGDDVAQMIIDAANAMDRPLLEGDKIIVAQKIISKSEGRLVDLKTVRPSNRAKEIAAASGKDPRFVEVILQESVEILRVAPGIVIAAHHCGAIMANAGIDRSNIDGGGTDDFILLLPQDPDESCRKLREAIFLRLGLNVGLIIGDSLGRPWRMGTTGTAIGSSGLPALLDLRGRPDLYGRTLMVSEEAIGDELAATASLLQGQGNEGLPVVIIRTDFDWDGPERPAAALARPKNMDLFR